MREEIVKFGTDLEDACWGVLFHDFGCDLRDEGFPIWRRDWRGICDFLAVVIISIYDTSG